MNETEVFLRRLFVLSSQINHKGNAFCRGIFFIIVCIVWSISLYGCGPPLTMIGLRAEYPEQRCLLFIDPPPAGFVPVDSLQPTLHWEPFPRKKDLETKIGHISDVTYQLRISGGGLFYSKDDLKQPYHKIDVPLKPSTKYLWTVRACFKLNNEPRCTVWGTVAEWFEYKSICHPNFSSYRFRTPIQ